MQNTTSPISVVMSTYNQSKYLSETINSVLNQSFKNFEFIIINDGSTDSTDKILNLYYSLDKRIRVVQRDRMGLAKSLNVGINSALGKYIARIDSDDICEIDRLIYQLEFLESNKFCVACGSFANVMNKDGEHLYLMEKPVTWNDIKRNLPNNPFIHPSVMMRKEIAIKCNGYDENLAGGQDLLLWNKMVNHGELWNIPNPLISYRLLPSALSNRSVRESKKLRNYIIQYSLDRDGNPDKIRRLNTYLSSRSSRYKKSNYYLNIGKIYIEKNFNRKNAALNLFKALLSNPLYFAVYYNLVILILPHRCIYYLKKLRGVIID